MRLSWNEVRVRAASSAKEWQDAAHEKGETQSFCNDLGKAYGQAGEYFDALRERDRPRQIMASDFRTFELHDPDGRQVVTSRPGIVRRSDRPAGLNADQETPEPAECPVVPSTPIFPEFPWQ